MSEAETRKFYNDYYKQLKGAVILEAGVKEEAFEYWPTFKISLANSDEIIEISLSRDEEGNGPGFLFGLPRPERVK